MPVVTARVTPGVRMGPSPMTPWCVFLFSPSLSFFVIQFIENRTLTLALSPSLSFHYDSYQTLHSYSPSYFPPLIFLIHSSCQVQIKFKSESNSKVAFP